MPPQKRKQPEKHRLGESDLPFPISRPSPKKGVYNAKKKILRVPENQPK